MNGFLGLNGLSGPLNLEGKKHNLEGTWRAVVGHLEGNAEIVKAFVRQQVTGDFVLTWREIRKSIYKELRVMSLELRVKRLKNKELQESGIHTMVFCNMLRSCSSPSLAKRGQGRFYNG
ncbi:MAG: hypothetical protein AB1442_07085 [Nitrospirota bacterium]